jgi:hypothetical protein
VAALETVTGFGIPAGKQRFARSTSFSWDVVGGATLVEGGIAAAEQPMARRITSNVMVMRMGVPTTSGRQNSPWSDGSDLLPGRCTHQI